MPLDSMSAPTPPYSTYPELIDYCKEHPGEVTMGVEVGGFTYMMVKSFEAATGVQFNLVDVGSHSDKCTALLGGHIDIMPNQYSTAKGYIESGDFVALGFPGRGAQRSLSRRAHSQGTGRGLALQWI